MNFEQAVQYTIEEEGGFSDHPDDDGGATQYGISIGFMRLIDPDVTPQDIRDLSLDGAKAIYKHHFWDAVQGDNLPPALALVTFDMAVTSGQGDAAKTLQAVVGAYEDGIIGPKTIQAVNAVQVWGRAIQEYTTGRILHFADHHDFEVFGKGWVARALRMHDRALRIVRNG